MVLVSRTLTILGQFLDAQVGLDNITALSYTLLDIFASRTSLRYARCINVACDGVTTHVIDDSTNSVGSYVAMTTGPHGFPIFAYHDAIDLDLKYAVCFDVLCDTVTKVIVDAAGQVPR